MAKVRSRRFTVAAAVVLAAAACLDPDEPIPETMITRMQAFTCVVPEAEVCQGRGAEVSTGTNPPRNQAFQVWAWHPGFNTTAWRLLWVQNDTQFVSDPANMRFGEDSVYQPVIIDLPDSIKTVGVRAYILGMAGADTVVKWKDSIMWTFP